MKYISRLTALLVALLVLCANIAGAEEGSVDSSALTEDQLASWYALTAEGTTKPIVADILGFPFTLTAYGDVTEEDLADYTFQWYNAITGEAIEGATTTSLSGTRSLTEQQYYCLATAEDGTTLAYDTFVIPVALTSDEDMESYLAILYGGLDSYEPWEFVNEFVLYDTMKIYQCMTETWNVTLSDGSNLAKKVLAAWWAEREQDDFDNELLCSCVIGGSVASDAFILEPGSIAHVSTCGWARDSVTTSMDVSMPDLLVEGATVTLTAPVNDANYYLWQEYTYNENTGEWEWVSVGSERTYDVTITVDSIQTSYRCVATYEVSETELLAVESAPFYLGGEKFFTWVTSTQTLSNGETTVAISDWLSIEGMTLEYVVAAFNASAKGIMLDEAIYVDVDAAEPALLELFGLSALATYDPATNYLTDVRYHIPVAVYDPATNTITPLTPAAAN